MKKFLIIIAVVIILLGCEKNIPEEKENIKSKISNEEISEKKEAEKKEIVELYKKIKKLNDPDFTKGIYLTSYTIASEKFKPILDKAEEAGINTVVFDIKNMKGDVFLSGGQKDSVRAEKYKPIINIAETVKELHRRKMKAVSRIVVFHDQQLAKGFPDLRPQRITGGAWSESKRREPSWLDSSNPKVQEEVLDIIEGVAKYGVDEIQMDYIRFPTQGKLAEADFYFQKEDKAKKY